MQGWCSQASFQGKGNFSSHPMLSSSLPYCVSHIRKSYLLMHIGKTLVGLPGLGTGVRIPHALPPPIPIGHPGPDRPPFCIPHKEMIPPCLQTACPPPLPTPCAAQHNIFLFRLVRCANSNGAELAWASTPAQPALKSLEHWKPAQGDLCQLKCQKRLGCKYIKKQFHTPSGPWSWMRHSTAFYVA